MYTYSDGLIVILDSINTFIIINTRLTYMHLIFKCIVYYLNIKMNLQYRKYSK